MRVLFEDNHLLALWKPAGMLTQPSGTEQESLEGLAKAWLRIRDHKPGNVFLEAVHRLDRPVSGIVLFAKTSKALSRMNEAMRQGAIQKSYSAWVEGDIKGEGGVLEHFLVHDDFKARVDASGKKCRLSYKVIERKNGQTFVEIELETGRYHQIRAQFAAIGHPIVGDYKYGALMSHPEGIALCHHRFSFPHPVLKHLIELHEEKNL